ncbi:MAG: noncanonical pyrimidine nucleotidase, YjjG family [Verrucomicrobia bacterium]|nr:noncanonical pyrimidine nucleotidase, YjjG family [Verrucomicrobiota bacterium]
MVFHTDLCNSLCKKLVKQYKHIFFDLDRTLWDFESNSHETLTELYHDHNIHQKIGVGVDHFIETYKKKNSSMWEDYRNGLIDKPTLRKLRFHHALLEYDYNHPDFAIELNEQYIYDCSRKTKLIDHSIEVLEYLFPKYSLHIITNGFVEAQEIKLKESGLKRFFEQIIISDGLGFKKPDKRIFHYAMKKAKALSANSIMVGDDYGPDVLGAKQVGMDQVFFNTGQSIHSEATYNIDQLIELKDIL